MKSITLLLSVILSFSAATHADAVFDRPGLLFTPETLARGSFAIEFGLPDFSYSKRQENREREFVYHSMFRYGMFNGLELQLELPYVRQQLQQQPNNHGFADMRIGSRLDLQTVLPWADAFAFQLGYTSDTGNSSVSAGQQQWDFGLAAGFEISDNSAVGLMLQRLQASEDGSSWILATDFSQSISHTLEYFIEAALELDDSSLQIGTGLIWLPRPDVQVDAYIIRGFQQQVPDWQFGLGIAFYFKAL